MPNLLNRSKHEEFEWNSASRSEIRRKEEQKRQEKVVKISQLAKIFAGFENFARGKHLILDCSRVCRNQQNL